MMVTRTFRTQDSVLRFANGWKVKIVRPLGHREHDAYDVGQMYRVRFVGFQCATDVFPDEIGQPVTNNAFEG